MRLGAFHIDAPNFFLMTSLCGNTVNRYLNLIYNRIAYFNKNLLFMVKPAHYE